MVRIAVPPEGAIRYGIRERRLGGRELAGNLTSQAHAISGFVVMFRGLPTSGRPGRPRLGSAWRLGAGTFALALAACKPDLVIGETTCFNDSAPDGGRDPEPTPPPDAPVPSPWSTGFESGFCDFLRESGYCYVNTEATHEVVRTPVHSGRFAAAFTVSTDDAIDALQARCVRRGVLPESGYYGAYYYVPNVLDDLVTWNLLHFEGWVGSTPRRLWDVSIDTSSGEPRLFVYDFLRSMARFPAAAPAIPVGKWFHVQFFWRRASDATGAFELYQDGQSLLALEGIVTDDSERGEWYVGNFTDGTMMAEESTVFVDDVSIRPTL